MKIIEELNEKIKNMNIFDISMLKLGLISFGMIIGAHFDYFVKNNLMTFIILWLVTWFYLIWKFYRH